MTDHMVDETTLIPRNLGPYRIERELGSGAMGTVFQAIHTGLDRAVALKVLRPDMVQDPDSVRRFLREARSIARMDHPSIVSVYDAGEIGGVSYIAMKLLEGESLQSLLSRTGPLPLSRVIHIAGQLASALDYAHARDVVHLDVKPANVMVARQDRVTLTDFGIAQALNPGATRSATIAGTPLYMSPEQIQGQEVDCRADIYSLGLVIYEMCVGRPPFHGQFVTVMYAHLHTPVPDIKATIPDMPDQFVAVINRALAKDPAQRYQTAGELLRALERAVPKGDADASHTVSLQREPLPAPSAVPVHDYRSTNVAAMPSDATGTEDGARAAQPAETAGGSRRTPLVAAGVAAVLVVVAAAALVLSQVMGTGAATGSIAIASVPSGASVSIDGKPSGLAPLTVNKMSQGTHSISLGLPTYNPRSVSVHVTGNKTTAIHVGLQSWPYKRLVRVTSAFLTSSVTVQPQTNNLIVGYPITTVPRSRFNGTVIYAISEVKLAPGLVDRRSVSVSPSYALYDPLGINLATFHLRSFTLNRGNPKALVTAKLHLRQTSKRQAPAGVWKIELLVNGELLKTLSFTTTG